MNISDLKKGDTAVVIAVYGDFSVKKRINAFGIRRGTRITVIGYSPFRSAVCVRCKGFTLAISTERAKNIRVQYDK